MLVSKQKMSLWLTIRYLIACIVLIHLTVYFGKQFEIKDDYVLLFCVVAGLSGSSIVIHIIEKLIPDIIQTVHKKIIEKINSL